MSEFELAVVGGGVVGASTAFFAARCGVRTALIEAACVGGSGATRYSGGIVRGYDPDPELAALGVLGSLWLGQWENLGLGAPSPLQETGVLYCCARDQRLDAVERAASFSDPAYPIEMLSPGEARECFPFLRAADASAVLFEPWGGWADAREVARRLAAAFVRRGGVLFENCPVQSLDERAGGGWHVELRHGRCRAESIVLATGALVRELAPSLPVQTRAIALAQFSLAEAAPPMPVIDENTGTYLRPLPGSGLYAGCGSAPATDPPARAHPGFVRAVCSGVERLLAAGGRCELVNSTCGSDGYTPDLRPLLGLLQERPRLYAATGFSGRGFKSALAVGAAIAAELFPQARQRTPAWPLPLPELGAFRPQRFAAAAELRTA